MIYKNKAANKDKVYLRYLNPTNPTTFIISAAEHDQSIQLTSDEQKKRDCITPRSRIEYYKRNI